VSEHRSVIAPLALMVFCGALVSCQTRLNGELAVRVGSPLAASTVNVMAGFVAVLVVLAVRRRPGRPRGARSARWWYWLGGVGGAVGSWSLAAGTPKVGVALISVCFASGLSTGGLLADRVGLGTSGRHLITPPRIGGAVLAIAAVVLAASGGIEGTGETFYLVWAIAAGGVVACQNPVNGRLAAALGDPVRTMAANFGVAFVILFTIVMIQQPALDWPGEPWWYTGGFLASVVGISATASVHRLGALRLGLAIVGGQLAGASLLDLVVPVGGAHLTLERVLGAALALVAVALSAGVTGPRSARVPAA
jgi:transporter family-2 protein